MEEKLTSCILKIIIVGLKTCQDYDLAIIQSMLGKNTFADIVSISMKNKTRSKNTNLTAWH